MSSGSSARQPGSGFETAPGAEPAGDAVEHGHDRLNVGEAVQPRSGDAAAAPAGEPVDRILTTLDRLGDRIRALSATSANVAAVHAARASADRQAPHAPAAEKPGFGEHATELQKAIEQIARKRDLMDREATVDHPSALRTPQGPDLSHIDALRADIATVREIVEAGSVAPRLGALEASYDEIVRRLDQMRNAIDNPRTVADLVQRLSEIRRLLAQAPTDAQLATIADRLDGVEARLGGTAGEGELVEMERQLAALATAVASLDTTDLLIAIDVRLDQVSQQVAALEQRLGNLDLVDGLQNAVERQGTVLSMLSQRTEQLPRVAHEMEGQSAAIEGLTRELKALPQVMHDLADLRGTLDAEAMRTQQGLQALIDRMDEIAARAGDETSAERLAVFVDERLAEVAQRFDAMAGSVDASMLAALDERFAAMETILEQRLSNVAASHPHQPPPIELLEALARVEERLTTDDEADRFAALEKRIADLAEAIDRHGPPGIAALEAAIAGIRSDIAEFAGASFTALETEVRSLARVMEDSRSSGIDHDQLARLEHRIGAIAERLDRAPAEPGRMEEALARFESSLMAALGDDGMIGEAARAAARAAIAESGAVRDDDGLNALRTELAALQREWLGGAERDRSLLAAIGDAVERLAAGEGRRPDPVATPIDPPQPTFSQPNTEEHAPVTPPAAMKPADKPILRAPAASEPAATAAPDIAIKLDRSDASTWSEIERTMSASIDHHRPLDSSADAVLAPDPSHVFGQETPSGEPTTAIDDRPLEPGSGKPRRHAAASMSPETAVPDLGTREQSKADFIAAARRAAQAAAVAPEVVAEPVSTWSGRLRGNKGGANPPGEGWRGRLQPVLGIFRRYRKRLLAATGIIIVASAATMLIAPTVARMFAPPPKAVESSSPAAASETPGDAATAVPERSDESATPADDAILLDDGGAPAPIGPATTFSVNADAPPADRFDRGAAGGAAASIAPAPEHSAAEDASEAARPGPSDSSSSEAAPSTRPVVAATDPTEAPPLPEAIGPATLRQAALAGDPRAQLEVASRFTEGRGVPQDVGEAVRWYRLAAEGGLAVAQYRLGSLFEKGNGVPRDLPVAASWYRAAADAGNIKAMHNLAVLTAEGIDGAPDYEAAALWFMVAAELGVRDSQYNLGILHAKGLGVPQDMTASYKWFAIAANAGDPDAAKKRDDVAQVLDKDALARARLAVETWSARTPSGPANETPPGDPSWQMVPEQTAALGNVGASISDVQATLATLGYDPGPPDGRIGERTRMAIEKFQGDRGLEVTGSVDADLIQALSERRI